MGLNQSMRHMSLPASADWPIRIYYGLVTLYQGLFGLFVDNSIFYLAAQKYWWVNLIVLCLLGAGLLLIADGALGMARYCWRLECPRLSLPMKVFHRWRHLLFLPPVFCYFMTLLAISHSQQGCHPVVFAYYAMLAAMGALFCLRDAMISSRCNRGRRRCAAD